MKTATDFPAIGITVVLALAAACSRDVPSSPVIPEPEPNRAPVAVGSIPAVTVEVNGSRRVDAAAYFSDPDGDALSYSVASSDPGVARVSVAGSAVTVAGVAKGAATVTVTASDGEGGTAHQVFAVTVPNRAPEAMAVPRDLVLEVGGAVLDLNLAEWFSDPDGDSLAYAAASTDTAVFRVEAVSNSMFRVSVGKAGVAALEAAATDPDGLSAGATVTVTVSRDRAALEALYHATGGADFWRRSDNWLTDAPLSAWYGVKVDSGGRVKALELGDNRLYGAVPIEIGDLSALEVLSLSSNILEGPIPPEIGNLTALEHLSLGANRFTGPIPPEIGNLAVLEHFSLAGNHLAGAIPAEIGDLSALKDLSLAGNRLSDQIPPDFGNLTALERLSLGGNDLTGTIPAEIGKLTALKTLRLFRNALSGPISPELANLAALEDLDINYNAGLCTPDDAPQRLLTWLSDLNVRLKSCAVLRAALASDRTALEVLYQATDGPNWERSDNWLTDAPVRDWYGVGTDSEGRVWNVWLQRNGLSGPIPPEIGNLTAVEVLSLDDNDLNGPIPPEIGNLRAVALLDLGRNNLNGRIPPEVGNLAALAGRAEGRPTLTSDYVLRLGNNNLSGPIPPEIGNLAALEILDLYGNDLTGPVPPEIGNLAAVAVLNLYGNDLSGSMPPEIGNLAALVHLDLSDNDLSGPIPAEIGNLAALLGLLLSDNSLNGPIPPELATLATLESLWLGDNDLSGPIPLELANLAALKSLRLDGNSNLCTPDDSRLLAWLAALNVKPPPRCASGG